MTIALTPPTTPHLAALWRGARVLPVLTLIAACGSTTTGSRASGTGGTGASPAAKVQFAAIQESLNHGKNATFKAVYTSTEGGTGSTSGFTTSTITLEQMPPNTLFSAGSGSSVIAKGSTVYVCSDNGGARNCLTEPSGANPLAGIESTYNGQTFLTLMQTTQSEIAAHVSGVSITYTDATFAGQASTCMNISAQGQDSKYCVTNSGILADVTSATATFQLTSFTTNVAASDFDLPAGATTRTLP